MQTLNLSGFLLALARTSAQAGLLVLLVLLVQWLFRKQLNPRWRCALWLVVAARLLLPVSLSSAASLFNLLPRPSQGHPSAETVAITAPSAGLPLPRQDWVKPVAPLAAVPEAVVPEAPAASAVAAGTPMPDTPSAHLQPATRASAPSVAFSWPLVLLCLWAAGVALLAAQLIISSLRMVRRFGRLPICNDPTVLAVLEECRSRLRVKTPLPVAECASVTSPALYGLLRPRLLLPPGFAAKFSAGEMEFVFLHELAHLKRRDLWLNWLFAALQVLHWFNPLVWFAFARWRADRELACDALALDAAGAGRSREYGQTILRLLDGYSHQPAAPALVGILEDKRQLQQRLRMIANFRPGRRWGVLSVGLLAVLAVVGLTDAQTAKPKSESPSALPPATATNSAATAREVRVGADPVLELTVTNAEVRTLTVTVLDDATGQPLPGAEVFAPHVGQWNQPQPQRLTDEQGKFVLRVVAVPMEVRRDMSSFSVSARAKDHAQRAVMWASAGGDVFAGVPPGVTIKLPSGVPIGGVVQDERGQALAGVRVLLFGSGNRGFTLGLSERNTNGYSELVLNDRQSPAAMTDAKGRWRFNQFPPDLTDVEVTFVRPDGAQETYATPREAYYPQRPAISLAELKEQTAVTRLSDGVTVRGLVVDEAGRPLSGVTVKEGYGHGNLVRISELTTGADGRFERPHRAPRQWIYTASRTDRATVSVVAQVAPGMEEVRLVLPPAKPLTLRVVDEAGQPMPEVEFTLDTYHTEAQILDWTATTDADGLAVWTNAPTDSVTFYALAKALGVSRKVKVAAGETEKRVVMSKAASDQITVRVKAVDAATRQPVKVHRVSAELGNALLNFTEVAAPFTNNFSLILKRSFFTEGMYPSFRLKLDADGYVSLVTEQMSFDEGNQDLDLALQPASGKQELLVLQSDGKPAAEARLWARATPDGGNLFINSPSGYHGDRLAKAQADDNGRLKLPGAPDDAPVVIAHASGFLDTTMAELRRSPEVRLQAFGVVQGRLLVAGQPKRGANVSLSSLTWSPASGFYLSYLGTSDAEGRFAFTQVPPGEFKLYRWMSHTMRGGGGRAITETYQMPITVRAGETNQVDYASTGRAVIGQARPDKPELEVDWQNDDHVLTLKLPGAAATPRPNREDYATLAAFANAMYTAVRSETPASQARAVRTYQLVFEMDGSFRAEDVPPGTYELRIRVSKPGEPQLGPIVNQADVLGSLAREVVVPDGKEPFDLGTLEILMKGEVGTQKSAQLDMASQTLDGKPVKLADYRGRPVVLVFWAAWSERSLEALADLQKLRTELGPKNSVAVLGLNLDDDLEAARSAVKTGSYDWPQAWLDAGARVKLTEAFGVNTLPTVLLLDAAGRITHRDLEGERLRTAVRRALPQK